MIQTKLKRRNFYGWVFFRKKFARVVRSCERQNGADAWILQAPAPRGTSLNENFNFPCFQNWRWNIGCTKIQEKSQLKTFTQVFQKCLKFFLVNHLDLRFLSVLAMDEISFRDCTKEWIEYNNPKPKMKPTPPTTTTKKITTTVRTTTTTSTTTSRTTTKRSLTTPRFLSTLRFLVLQKSWNFTWFQLNNLNSDDSPQFFRRKFSGSGSLGLSAVRRVKIGSAGNSGAAWNNFSSDKSQIEAPKVNLLILIFI